MSDNIKVAIKLRPLISRELEENLSEQWKVCGNSLVPVVSVNGSQNECTYVFDHVFDTLSKNENVYQAVVKPITEAAVNGINGTIFAYGQTSSGKTYTMMGNHRDSGIIQLVVEDIFQLIAIQKDREYLVRASYIEIYNEKIHDLLIKAKTKIKVTEDANGMLCLNVKEEVTDTPSNLLQIMRRGEKNRHTGETNMNEHSSRSHTIFRIIIESRVSSDPEGAVQYSHLNLVDLAGSERVSQTGATGNRFREGNFINLSLFTLSCVIKQLSEQNDPKSHIPFRNSKLTRILQSSLGGNAKTVIICAITPASLEESMSTLAFAARAKSVKNKPEVNESISNDVLLKRYAKQIEQLRDELAKEKTRQALINIENKQSEENRRLQERISLLEKFMLRPASAPSVAINSTNSMYRQYLRRQTWCGTDKFIPNNLQQSTPIKLAEASDHYTSDSGELIKYCKEKPMNAAVEHFKREYDKFHQSDLVSSNSFVAGEAFDFSSYDINNSILIHENLHSANHLENETIPLENFELDIIEQMKDKLTEMDQNHLQNQIDALRKELQCCKTERKEIMEYHNDEQTVMQDTINRLREENNALTVTNNILNQTVASHRKIIDQLDSQGQNQNVLKAQKNNCTHCSSDFSFKENLTKVAMDLNNGHETKIRQLLQKFAVENTLDKNEHLDELVLQVMSKQQHLEKSGIEILKKLDRTCLLNHFESLLILLPKTLELLDVNKKALTSMQSINLQQCVQISSLKEKNHKRRGVFNWFNELEEEQYKTDGDFELDDVMNIIKDTVQDIQILNQEIFELQEEKENLAGEVISLKQNIIQLEDTNLQLEKEKKQNISDWENLFCQIREKDREITILREKNALCNVERDAFERELNYIKYDAVANESKRLEIFEENSLRQITSSSKNSNSPTIPVRSNHVNGFEINFKLAQQLKEKESQLMSIIQNLEDTNLLHSSKIAEIETLKKKSEKLKDDLKEVTNKYEVLKEKEKSLEQVNKILKAQLSEMEGEKAQQESFIIRLSEKLVKEKDSCSEIQSRIAEIKTLQNEKPKDDLADVTNKRKSLMICLREKLATENDSSLEIDSKVTELKTLEIENEKLKQDLIEVARKYEVLKENEKSVHEVNTILGKQILELEIQKAQQDSLIICLREKLAKENDSCLETHSEIAKIKTLENENGKLKDNLKEVTEKYEFLKEKENAVQEKNTVLETQISEIEVQKLEQERLVIGLREKLMRENDSCLEIANKVAILENENGKLKDDLKEITKKYEVLKEKDKVIQEENTNLEKQILEIGAQKVEQEGLIISLHEKLARKDDSFLEIHRKLAELNTLENENEKLKQDLKEVLKNYEVLKEEEKVIQEENTNLEKQISEIGAQKVEQEGLIISLHEKLARKNDSFVEIHRKMAELNTLENENEKLKQDLKEVIKNYEVLKEEEKSVQEDNMILEAQIAEIEAEKTQMDSLIQSLRQKLARENESSKEIHTKYQKQIENLLITIHKLENDLKTATQEKLKLLEDEILSLRSTIANYETESTLGATIKLDNERFEKELRDMKIQLKDYECVKEKNILISENVIMLKQEIENKNLKLLEIENSSLINSNENKSLKATIENLNTEAVTLKLTNESLQKSLSEMHIELENLEKLQQQIKTLQIEKQRILEKLTAIENELVEIKAENELLNKSLVSLKEAHEQLNLRNVCVAENQNSEDNTNRLKSKNEFLNNTIHELQSNCEKLKQECQNEKQEKFKLNRLLENKQECHENNKMKQLHLSNKKLQSEIQNQISEHRRFVENSERLMEAENLRRGELQAKNVNLEKEIATLNKTIHELQLNCEKLKLECYNEALEKMSLKNVLENKQECYENNKIKQLLLSNKKLQSEIQNKIAEHQALVENGEQLMELENLRRMELQAKSVNLEIENATLTSVLQTKEQEILNLKKKSEENQELNAKLQKLSLEKSSVLLDLINLQLEIKNVTNTREMEEFVDDLKLMEIANDIKTMITNLHTENTKLKSQIKIEQELKNQLHNQFQVTEDELNQIKSNKKLLETTSAKIMEDRIEKLEKIIAAKEEKYKITEDRIKELEKIITAKEEKYKITEDRIKELEKIIAAKEEKYKITEDRVKELEKIIAAQEEKYQTLKSGATKLKNQMKPKNVLIAQLKADLRKEKLEAQLQKQSDDELIIKLRTECADLRVEQENILSQLSRYKNKVQAIEAENKKLNSELEKIKMKASHDTFAAELKSKMEEDIKTLNITLKTKEQQLKLSIDEHAKATLKIYELETKLKSGLQSTTEAQSFLENKHLVTNKADELKLRTPEEEILTMPQGAMKTNRRLSTSRRNELFDGSRPLPCSGDNSNLEKCIKPKSSSDKEIIYNHDIECLEDRKKLYDGGVSGIVMEFQRDEKIYKLEKKVFAYKKLLRGRAARIDELEEEIRGLKSEERKITTNS